MGVRGESLLGESQLSVVVGYKRERRGPLVSFGLCLGRCVLPLAWES